MFVARNIRIFVCIRMKLHQSTRVDQDHQGAAAAHSDGSDSPRHSVRCRKAHTALCMLLSCLEAKQRAATELPNVHAPIHTAQQTNRQTMSHRLRSERSTLRAASGIAPTASRAARWSMLLLPARSDIATRMSWSSPVAAHVASDAQVQRRTGALPGSRGGRHLSSRQMTFNQLS